LTPLYRQQPYRIIVSVRPYYAIALGANLKEVRVPVLDLFFLDRWSLMA
jgi:hypothetical protein